MTERLNAHLDKYPSFWQRVYIHYAYLFIYILAAKKDDKLRKLANIENDENYPGLFDVSHYINTV